MFNKSSLLRVFGVQIPPARFLHQKPHEGFVYTGNPFETKIKLKREIPDPSLPNFKEVECLKWTNWRMLRDVKKRYINAEYWQYRLNMKNIGRNMVLPSLVKDIAWEERMATPRDSSVTHLTNRCALSSRARGKFPRYRLSRNIYRECADHGQLSGVIRAKWG